MLSPRAGWPAASSTQHPSHEQGPHRRGCEPEYCVVLPLPPRAEWSLQTSPAGGRAGQTQRKKILHAWGWEQGATPELKQGLQSRRNPRESSYCVRDPGMTLEAEWGRGCHSPQQAGQCQIPAQSRKTTTSYGQEPLLRAHEGVGAPESHSETASNRGSGGNKDTGKAALPPTPT